MELLVFDDALIYCAPSVADGRMPDDPLVGKAVNGAQQFFLNSGQFKGTTRRLKFTISNNTIALPRGYDAILKCSIDNYPARVWGPSYELAPGGPNVSNWPGALAWERVLIDLGPGFGTWYPIGLTPRKLVAMTTDKRDVGQSITVYGEDLNGMRHGDGEGVQVPLVWWRGGEYGQMESTELRQTSQLFLNVENYKKPITKGYVSLLSYEQASATDAKFGLLHIGHPDEERPVCRRYRVRPQPSSCNASFVTALCTVGFVKLTRGEDVLPVQHLEATRLIIKSFRARDGQDVNLANALEADALRMLRAQSQQNRTYISPHIAVDPLVSSANIPHLP